MSLKFWSNSPVLHISANVFPQQPHPSVITIMQNKHFAVNPWNNNPAPARMYLNQKRSGIFMIVFHQFGIRLMVPLLL